MNNFPPYPSILDAIRCLLPGITVECAVHNEDLNRIDWMMDDVEQPSADSIETKLNELKAEYPMKLLRYYRDKLLEETDWVTMRSYSTNTPVPEEWASYQQALRDLPETATPVLDLTSPLGISGVDWPVKPQ